MSYKERTHKLHKQLDEEGLDAILVSNRKNIFYLTGFDLISHTDREAFLLIHKEFKTIFLPQMYSKEAQNLLGIEKVFLSKANDLFEKPIERIKGFKKVGFESNDISFHEYQNLNKNKVNLSPTTKFIEKLRIHKDEIEMQNTIEAMEITENSLKNALKQIKDGMSEKELARIIKAEFEKFGASESFDTIVAFGDNSAKPHHKPTDRKIENGILLIDLGAKFNNYCGDMTRTFFIGEPDDTFKKRFDLVRKSHENSILALKLKESYKSIWKIAVKSLNEESINFTKYHSLGHGVGLDIHENFSIHQTSQNFAENGHVFTIEPGIYYPDWGGIRIEDLCIMKNSGVLRYPKMKVTYSIDEVIK